MKTSQKEIVIKQLKEHGEVSRNWCLQNYISRLSAIIQLLEKEGWEFEPTHDKCDYVYKVTKSKFKTISYFIPLLNKTVIKYEPV